MADSVTPSFFVDKIPVFGDTILAPMDGYSDQPYRILTRQFGSAMSYTEFINAIDVINGNPNLVYRTSYTEDERPVVFQIYDDDPDRILKVALQLRERNPDVIDINMGCSVRRIVNRGAGAGLLREPQKIGLIFKKLSQALDIPVTGKIRLGWDHNTKNYLLVGRIIEDNGGKLIAVHARTRDQAYSDKPDWDTIAELKQSLSIPVIGNGDIQSVADIDQFKKHTQCDAVMIGRGAIGNPWIFARQSRGNVPFEQLLHTIRSHCQQMMRFYGEELGISRFRKHLKGYIEPYCPTREQRAIIFPSSSLEELSRNLYELRSQKPLPITVSEEDAQMTQLPSSAGIGKDML